MAFEKNINPNDLPQDLIFGSDKNVTISLGQRNTNVIGGSGNEDILAGTGFDTIDGGSRIGFA